MTIVGQNAHLARTSRIAVVLLAVAFGACSSEPAKVEPPAAVDERFNLASRAARLAFDRGQYEQAASLYRQALDLAYTRDDLDAIVDAQYNAAVCHVKLGQNEQALELVQRAAGELARAKRPLSSDLALLEATVRYRRGEHETAWELTEPIVSSPDTAPGDAAKRAHFLRGLIAAERKDLAGLERARAALASPQSPRLLADYSELSGHVAVAEERYADATRAFTHAGRLRSDTGDYRGIVRALTMAGAAAEKAGDLAQASSHFLRAGRSAAIQGTSNDAERLLERAATLAGEAGEEKTAQEANTILAGLRNPDAER